MVNVIWTEPALNNLEEIIQYIAISNSLAAKKLAQSVFKRTKQLVDHPKSGRIPKEINEFNYRELIVKPCRIFYKFQDDIVYILYVLRQESDIRRYILGVEV